MSEALCAMGLGTKSLVGVVVGVMVKKKRVRFCFFWSLLLGASLLVVVVVGVMVKKRVCFFWQSMESVDAVADVRRHHFNYVILF